MRQDYAYRSTLRFSNFSETQTAVGVNMAAPQFEAHNSRTSQIISYNCKYPFISTLNRFNNNEILSPHTATATTGPGSPHYRGFTITLRHTTLGMTPLDEWSAWRRDLYLTGHNTHNRQTSMTPAGNYNEIIKALSLCGITARDIQLLRRSQ